MKSEKITKKMKKAFENMKAWLSELISGKGSEKGYERNKKRKKQN